MRIHNSKCLLKDDANRPVNDKIDSNFDCILYSV